MVACNPQPPARPQRSAPRGAYLHTCPQACPTNLCQTGPHACLCVHPDLGLKQDSLLLSSPAGGSA